MDKENHIFFIGKRYKKTTANYYSYHFYQTIQQLQQWKGHNKAEYKSNSCNAFPSKWQCYYIIM
ncbi:hypothetical protein CLI70_02640, partial [Prevotella intermedia]